LLNIPTDQDNAMEKCHQSLVPANISQVLQVAHAKEIQRSVEPNV
jgi:hypothetical protein